MEKKVMMQLEKRLEHIESKNSKEEMELRT